MKLVKFALATMLMAAVFTACSDDDDDKNSEVSFESLVANGSATETTTVLTLRFSAEIAGLTADDITLTSGETEAIKDSLTAKGNGVYELAISNVLSAGDVSVRVAKEGYVITSDSKTVAVFYYYISVSFESLVANGSEAKMTTVLTLQFSEEITGLTADDITLTSGATGAIKDSLTAKGNGVYELAISNVLSAGDVSVSVAKTGYVITPASIDVAVYRGKPINLDDFVGTMSLDDPFYKRTVYDVESSKISDTELEITNIYVAGKKLKIVVDLNAHTVTVPEQLLFALYGPYTNLKVKGSGTIDGVNKVITFTAKHFVDQLSWGDADFVLTHKPDAPSE